MAAAFHPGQSLNWKISTAWVAGHLEPKHFRNTVGLCARPSSQELLLFQVQLDDLHKIMNLFPKVLSRWLATDKSPTFVEVCASCSVSVCDSAPDLCTRLASLESMRNYPVKVVSGPGKSSTGENVLMTAKRARAQGHRTEQNVLR